MKKNVLSLEENEFAVCLHNKLCNTLDTEDVVLKIEMNNISVFSSGANSRGEILLLGNSISDDTIKSFRPGRFLTGEEDRNTKMLRTMINKIIKNKNIFTNIHILNNYLYCSISFRFEDEQIFLDLWLGSVLYGKEGRRKSFAYKDNNFISTDGDNEKIDSYINLTNEKHHKLFDEYKNLYRDVYERRNDRTIFEYSLGLS
ncbi:MAG: hypothetical protein K5930_01350 [Treponemataceae bacterium]|nr:hypothetical protein [Treponemataceae bacterium]